MKQVRVVVSVIVLMFCCVSTQAQQTVATNTNVVVPPLINFSGTLTELNGKPLTGTVAVTFSLYSEQTGDAALWMETQNVQSDVHGHYTVMLGSTSSTGLPSDIFVAGQAHWLGVQVEGEQEQPRVLLVSAPYALKAGDAQTLGGLPASAFVLAAPPNGAAMNTAEAVPSTSATASVSSDTSSDVTTTGGTVDALPLFSTATNIQNSLLTQTGTIAINVSGKLNLPSLGTATSSAGFNSRPLDFVASAYDSSTAAAAAQTFQWQAQAADNDTATPSATLNLLYGLGANKPAQTGLQIASNGQLTFATGQTFPGTGTISGVTAGTGLTGGGGSGTVTLNVDTSTVPLLNAANTFVGNQAISGNLADTGNITATGSITGQTGTFSANSSNPVETITQSGTGVGLVVNAGGATYGIKSTASLLGVYATATAAGGDGVSGNSTGGVGVYGYDNATSGTSVGVTGQSTSSSGYGVEGTSSNVGVFGQGSYGVNGHGTLVGVKGVATASGGLSGLFQGGPVNIAGNNSAALIGDPGCGSGFSGIGLTNQLSGCANYTLIADTKGDTYLNSISSGGIHFRNNNNGGNSYGDLATIDHAGNMTVAGTVHSGNAFASVSASNATDASTDDCVLPLSAPNSNCLTPNMTLTVTTSGGPVLIMANIGGVNPYNYAGACAAPNFYLIMDSQIIATQNLDVGVYGLTAGGYYILTATMLSLQTPAAGTHTFQVQEADDASMCGSGDYGPTLVSANSSPGFPNPTRTLIVREF